jgi:hypothetical protein
MRAALIWFTAAAAALAACGGNGGGKTKGALGRPHMQPTGDRQVTLVLFRDAALVREKWRVPLVNGKGSVEVPLDAGIVIDDLAVISTEGAKLLGLSLRGAGPSTGDQVVVDGKPGELLLTGGWRQGYYDEHTGEYVERHATDVVIKREDSSLHIVDPRGMLEYKSADTGSSRAEISLEGTGTEAWIELTYPTPRIAWSAAYSLIRDASGNRASLDGAVAIDNSSGVAFPGAAVTVVDSTFDTARSRSATELAKSLLGTAKETDKSGGRELGLVDVERGQTRLALAAAPHPLRLKEILVFDPVGTRFDSPGSMPQKAKNHGLEGKPSTTVLRSFEIELDQATRESLPAGPVRLFGRGEHGELSPLGAGRLFDRSQGEAKTATVPVGRSPEVKAKRSRTDFYIDEEGTVDAKGVRTRRQIIEEFTIVLENSGTRAVEVMVREHLYRGETWALAYYSDTAKVAKEGPQQIAMRVAVPAGGETRVVYRVVYNW